MTTPAKPKHLRWLRRIAVVMLAGVVLTLASTWGVQWRGFAASRQVRWVQGPHVQLTSWMVPPHLFYDSGDGIRMYDPDLQYELGNNPSPQHTATQPAEIPWVLTMLDWGGNIRWSAERHLWDSLAPIEGYNNAEERVHIRPTRGHFFDISARGAYFSTRQAPAWHAQARELVPHQAKHARLDPQEPLEGQPFLDRAPGWVCASAFLVVPGQTIQDSSIEVERWSAQRCGWPVHAMMIEQYAIGPRPPIERVQGMPLASLRHGIRGGLILHHQPQHPMLHPLGHYSLPLMPLWPGFAINTLFYSACVATLWLAFATTRHAVNRKRRRRARGLCESCGYDITGLTQCPECGRPATNEKPATNQ